MKSALARVSLAVFLSGVLPMSALLAQESKALPTLLIKGEVVSLDTSDPAASLLKVKDRYGFETPIFLTPETEIQGADATALAASNLTTGAAVEVEYNFDVNTAKRHAVSVKVTSTPAAAQPAEAPAAPAAPEAAAPAAPVEAPAPAAAEPAPAAETQPADSAPVPEAAPAEAAPVTQ